MQSVTIKLIADSDMLNINGFSRQTIAFASDFPEISKIWFLIVVIESWKNDSINFVIISSV